jgi:diguanylate cyclase
MIDKLTFLWVRRIYDLVYHLMVWRKGYMVFVDLDNFREINNRYGHPLGDKVLRKIGITLLVLSRFRAFRYGGDEFCILWSSKEKARQLAEKVRKKIEETDIEGLRITVTCVVAQYEEETSRLLNEAKEKGKNRVITVE